MRRRGKQNKNRVHPGKRPRRKSDDNPTRTGRILRHRRPAEARASRRQAHRRLDHRQSRSLGYREADGAAGAAGAARGAAPARRTELELAPKQNARGVLALSPTLPPPPSPPAPPTHPPPIRRFPP